MTTANDPVSTPTVPNGQAPAVQPVAAPDGDAGGRRRVMIMQRDHDAVPTGRRRSSSTDYATERVCKVLRDLGVEPVECDYPGEVELLLVLGGDGTILRGSEIARQRDIPLLGINTGHVGFLAEADPEAVEQVVADIVACSYTVEERMTLSVEIVSPDGSVQSGWALNEAALSKRGHSHMIEVAIGVDDQAVSSFGCDGLIASTPTGSTAYAFSCGGPVVWPDVSAMLLVPVAAHALFTRPLVVGPESVLDVLVQRTGGQDCDVWCDGRRRLEICEGSHIRVTRGQRPVRLARLNDAPFSGRLVAKFDLPVEGWRAAATREGAAQS